MYIGQVYAGLCVSNLKQMTWTESPITREILNMSQAGIGQVLSVVASESTSNFVTQSACRGCTFYRLLLLVLMVMVLTVVPHGSQSFDQLVSYLVT